MSTSFDQQKIHEEISWTNFGLIDFAYADYSQLYSTQSIFTPKKLAINHNNKKYQICIGIKVLAIEEKKNIFPVSFCTQKKTFCNAKPNKAVL